MKYRFLKLKVALILIVSFSSCKESITFDLVIKNVTVFDAPNKQVLENKTILINSDTIVAIVDFSNDLKAKKFIEGNGRLITPGFVDTHIHLTDVYGEEYEKLYNMYVDQGKYREKIKARKLWNKILESQIETGVPYIGFKDNVNEKTNQKNGIQN